MANKALIVDDSPADLANIRSIVTGAGWQVVSAVNGAEALDKARKERPTVIFMDIVMPDMDGYEACRRLAADPETKGVPVVFVSNKNQKADHVWAKAQGGRALVSKPYTPDQILEQLKAVG